MLVRNNLNRLRYELFDEDTLAGFIDYRVRDGQYWLVHTEINDGYSGTGAASFLVRSTLDQLRERDVQIVPTCPFVGGWLRRHPDYQDMVDQETLRTYKRSRSGGRRRVAQQTLPPNSGPNVASPCSHVPANVASIPTPWPDDGCAECIAAGVRDWVHLRACQSCGHVGCCDSSPGRHATAHFTASNHPVVRSYEISETWWFCYLDTITFEVADTPEARSAS